MGRKKKVIQQPEMVTEDGIKNEESPSLPKDEPAELKEDSNCEPKREKSKVPTRMQKFLK